MNIYVGNVSYRMTEDELRAAFEAYGEVESARVITDRETGRSKGFAFVEMPDSEQAQKAIEELNGSEIGGRQVTVNEARPRTEGGGGGFRGNRGPRNF
jgi:cold-inducible RNA-binding protein